MANELLSPRLTADVTYYALIFSTAGTIWNGSAFETYVDANYATYPVTMTELGTSSGVYAADLPGALSTTTAYSYLVMRRAGGSPAITDVQEAQGVLGPAVLNNAGIATAIWQDTTAGDFTVASSIGKSVMNGVALGTGLTVNSVTNRVTADTDQINGSAAAATNLKNTMLSVVTATVQTNGGNTATTFDTNLTTEAANYYAGLVVAFVSTANDKYQTRKISSSVTSGGNTSITLDSALDAIPSDGDTFVVLGRG